MAAHTDADLASGAWAVLPADAWPSCALRARLPRSPPDLANVLVPIALRALALLRAAESTADPHKRRRIVIAIGGYPGAGKSTLAAMIASAINDTAALANHPDDPCRAQRDGSPHLSMSSTHAHSAVSVSTSTNPSDLALTSPNPHALAANSVSVSSASESPENPNALWPNSIPMSSALIDSASESPENAHALLPASMSSPEIACAWSMDAYHMTNAELAARGWAHVKGSRRTFRPIDLLADLRRLCSPSDAGSVLLPAYCRSLHEPVPNAVRVEPHHRIIILEGLYVLLGGAGTADDGVGPDENAAWADILALVDLPLFVTVDEHIGSARLIARKVSTGRDPATAADHVARVDVPNRAIIAPSMSRAQLVIDTSAGQLSASAPSFQGEQTIPAAALLAVGPNPAMQRTLVFGPAGTVTLGAINRATRAHVACGGKGQQCAIAAGRLRPGVAAVAQFLGDREHAGHFVHDRLQNVHGITTQLTEWVPGVTTRTCITLLDGIEGARMTELIEPSGTVSASSAAQLLLQIAALVPTLRGVALCGTLPPGVGPDFYVHVSQYLRSDAVLLVDAAAKVSRDVLQTGRCDVLKVNADELRELCGDAASHTLHGLAELLVLARGCFEKGWLRAGPRSAVCVTDGLHPAIVVRGDGAAFSVSVPRVACVNPIGAGDTCAGVTLFELAYCHSPVVDAFAWGIAAASASCLSLEGADFSFDDMARLRQTMVVEAVA
jgi:fructose-1-phosphate kinase PfkB-like protein/pantothenate kinase